MSEKLLEAFQVFLYHKSSNIVYKPDSISTQTFKKVVVNNRKIYNRANRGEPLAKELVERAQKKALDNEMEMFRLYASDGSDEDNKEDEDSSEKIRRSELKA